MGLKGELDFSLAGNPALFKETQKALKTTGVKLLDIENARIHDTADVDSYFPEMEIAAELGAQAVLTNVWTKDHNLTIDLLSQLCQKGEELGLNINLEFVTWSEVRNIQDAVTILDECHFNNCGMVVDTLHFHRSRCHLDELAALPKKYLSAIHLCDVEQTIPSDIKDLIHAGRAERLYVGEGDICIADIVQAMPPVVLGIEIPHLERLVSIGSAEHVFRCIETAKEYLKRHSLI